jgi:hypothetical protein
VLVGVPIPLAARARGVKREQLEHVLRAAAQIAGDPDVLVIGSQSILGSVAEDELPDEATASIEVDVAFFDDADNTKSDRVDGAIGELSSFHELFGYYAQGVSASTAVLPRGWRQRVVVVQTASSSPGRGHCLDRYDCAVSKLVAGREKDHRFVAALIHEGLVDATRLAERVELLDDVHPLVLHRVREWVASQR